MAFHVVRWPFGLLEETGVGEPSRWDGVENPDLKVVGVGALESLYIPCNPASSRKARVDFDSRFGFGGHQVRSAKVSIVINYCYNSQLLDDDNIIA